MSLPVWSGVDYKDFDKNFEGYFGKHGLTTTKRAIDLKSLGAGPMTVNLEYGFGSLKKRRVTKSNEAVIEDKLGAYMRIEVIAQPEREGQCCRVGFLQAARASSHIGQETDEFLFRKRLAARGNGWFIDRPLPPLKNNRHRSWPLPHTYRDARSVIKGKTSYRISDGRMRRTAVRMGPKEPCHCWKTARLRSTQACTDY